MPSDGVIHSAGSDDGKPRLLVFYSDTSGPCRKVDGYLAQVLQRHQNHHSFKLIRVRVDEQPKVVERLAIQALPTLMVVERGTVQARLDGPRGRAEIENTLTPWLRTGRAVHSPLRDRGSHVADADADVAAGRGAGRTVSVSPMSRESR